LNFSQRIQSKNVEAYHFSPITLPFFQLLYERVGLFLAQFHKILGVDGVRLATPEKFSSFV